jgi:hypothetical protein
MGDKVIGASSNERQVAWLEFEGGVITVNPQPRMSLNHGVHCELYRAWQSKPPRRDSNRPRKYAPGCAGSDQMFLQNVHEMIVSHK